MALIKHVMTDSGPASFWVVSLLQLDNFGKKAYVKIYGFYDKEHADRQNPRAVHTIEISVDPELYEEYFAPDLEVVPLDQVLHHLPYDIVSANTLSVFLDLQFVVQDH